MFSSLSIFSVLRISENIFLIVTKTVKPKTYSFSVCKSRFFDTDNVSIFSFENNIIFSSLLWDKLWGTKKSCANYKRKNSTPYMYFYKHQLLTFSWINNNNSPLDLLIHSSQCYGSFPTAKWKMNFYSFFSLFLEYISVRINRKILNGYFWTSVL